jgi:hypothetical protein
MAKPLPLQPMHQLRHQLESQQLGHVALEQMPVEKRGTIVAEAEIVAVEQADDVRVVVVAKSAQSQNLIKRLLVSDG